MKNSELRQLIAKYKELKIKSKKHNVSKYLEEIEHRYYHETGKKLEDVLK